MGMIAPMLGIAALMSKLLSEGGTPGATTHHPGRLDNRSKQEKWDDWVRWRQENPDVMVTPTKDLHDTWQWGKEQGYDHNGKGYTPKTQPGATAGGPPGKETESRGGADRGTTLSRLVGSKGYLALPGMLPNIVVAIHNLLSQEQEAKPASETPPPSVISDHFPTSVERSRPDYDTTPVEGGTGGPYTGMPPLTLGPDEAYGGYLEGTTYTSADLDKLLGPPPSFTKPEEAATTTTATEEKKKEPRSGGRNERVRDRNFDRRSKNLRDKAKRDRQEKSDNAKRASIAKSRTKQRERKAREKTARERRNRNRRNRG